MRLTKNESHKHKSIKFVKKFAIIPRKVQSQWIFWEHYYVGYEWDFISSEIKSTYESHLFRLNPSQYPRLSEKSDYTSFTHKWSKFAYFPLRLEEDTEVQKWLIQNSPLALALKE